MRMTHHTKPVRRPEEISPSHAPILAAHIRGCDVCSDADVLAATYDEGLPPEELGAHVAWSHLHDRAKGDSVLQELLRQIRELPEWIPAPPFTT